jgi:extracellular factor (EF) 3-hydroxypalmitic acid methyl ester biosynthesis protein
MWSEGRMSDVGTVHRTELLTTDFARLLDTTHTKLADNDVSGALESFEMDLDDLRRRTDRDTWWSFCQQALNHPIRNLLHNGPITSRAFSKPRGYAGDAGTMDLLYIREPLSEDISPLGEALYPWEVQLRGARSVRARRSVLAHIIDEVALQVSRPRVLSVACGHLRELEESCAARRGAFEDFIALDQDAQSLAVVDEHYGELGVETVHDTVRSLITGQRGYSGFDLIYSGGLYDYLGQSTAIRLTRKLFDMLRPGGRLVVANFAPNLRSIGYMEALTDWRLIYRSEPEMQQLTAEIVPERIARTRLFRDIHEYLVFLKLVRQ